MQLWGNQQMDGEWIKSKQEEEFQIQGGLREDLKKKKEKVFSRKEKNEDFSYHNFEGAFHSLFWLIFQSHIRLFVETIC